MHCPLGFPGIAEVKLKVFFLGMCLGKLSAQVQALPMPSELSELSRQFNFS